MYSVVVSVCVYTYVWQVELDVLEELVGKLERVLQLVLERDHSPFEQQLHVLQVGFDQHEDGQREQMVESNHERVHVVVVEPVGEQAGAYDL